MKLLLTLLAAMVLVACAPHSHEIRAKEVSVEAYQEIPCTEIFAQLDTKITKLKALATDIDEAADADETQTTVGVIFLWPVLFALEGSETPDSELYSQLRGECVALEHTAVLKGCQDAVALAETWHEEEEQARLERVRLEQEQQSWHETGDDF